LLFTVLPTIGSSQQAVSDAGTVVPDAETVGILRGDLSTLPPMEADAVRVYLCYDSEGEYTYYYYYYYYCYYYDVNHYH